jgi:hypothetical protein
MRLGLRFLPGNLPGSRLVMLAVYHQGTPQDYVTCYLMNWASLCVAVLLEQA